MAEKTMKSVKDEVKSIKFSIKNTETVAEKEGDTFVRFSGTGEPYRRVSERASRLTGVDAKGDSTLIFATGLDPEQVDFFTWYNDEEKRQVRKTIEDLKPHITKFYGGEKVVDPTNKYFWRANRDVYRLSLSHETSDVFYDTAKPAHALLYLSIISGAFVDTVAPTKEWAERNQIPHFLALESEDTFENEDQITKSDAHGALSELRRESPEGLFILAWCLQYDTNAFGGISRATPPKHLINTHIQYIEGKLVTRRKKNTPKLFIEYANKWKGQQTRDRVYAEAYVKAGEYFNYIHKKDGQYVTADGIGLGKTIDESVDIIMKSSFNEDFQKLRDQVEAKWKE